MGKKNFKGMYELKEEKRENFLAVKKKLKMADKNFCFEPGPPLPFLQKQFVTLNRWSALRRH